jgi:hypothetical protein
MPIYPPTVSVHQWWAELGAVCQGVTGRRPTPDELEMAEKLSRDPAQNLRTIAAEIYSEAAVDAYFAP